MSDTTANPSIAGIYIERLQAQAAADATTIASLREMLDLANANKERAMEGEREAVRERDAAIKERDGWRKTVAKLDLDRVNAQRQRVEVAAVVVALEEWLTPAQRKYGQPPNTQQAQAILAAHDKPMKDEIERLRRALRGLHTASIEADVETWGVKCRDDFDAIIDEALEGK